MNPKHSLYEAEGFLVIVLGCGYLGLTFYSLWRWNEAISGALVTGYALFAKETVTRFFDLVAACKARESNDNAAVSVTPAAPKV